MGARNGSWWQPVKRHRTTILVVAIIIIVATALIIVGYRLDWTGFNGNSKQGKTLWDWLQLLIIPFVLAIGGYLFNLTVSRNERKAAANRDKTERDIALDNQQEATLQEYINKMSELLLDVHRPLRKSNEDDEVQKIARVRTLTVHPRFNGSRKRSLLQFLYEARLINNDESIIDLSDANLRDADLSYATLCSATMSGADLSDAVLNDAVLNDADLRGANLHGADLSDAKLCNVTMIDADLVIATMIGADLRGADLRGPDLSGPYLSHANLEETDLSRASLNGADLSLAILFSANLEKADLSHANLEGARGFTPEALEKVAKSLEGATMPNGSIHL